MTGFGPRETWTVTWDPKATGPADGSGTVPITWPFSTDDEYWFAWTGTNPAAVSAAAAGGQTPTRWTAASAATAS